MDEKTLYNLQNGISSFVNSNNIQIGGVKSQNQSIMLGNKQTGYLLIDYINKRIIINDGKTNRIVIGFT